MRLLNTKTGRFVLVGDPRTVHYAILSHVWSKKDDPDYVPEQTYQDVCRILAEHNNQVISSPPSGERSSSAGDSVPARSVELPPSEESILPYLSDKIRHFCEVANADGFELAWADTCCLDQTNPSELEEAITSMYDWYAYSKACYVFLPDVSDRGRDAGSQERWESEFRRSQWFLRGWTLQELLAPNVVIFMSKNWQVMGSKHGLAALVEDITSIEAAIIRCENPLSAVSVARRMAWAASRKTLREEDRAYSMLGIFGVNIRITYGEGSYAFYRLQEAIINEIPDQTIFVWHPQNAPMVSLRGGAFSRLSDEHPSPPPTSMTTTLANKQLPNLPVNALYDPRWYLLAESPQDFKYSADIGLLTREEFAETLGVALAHVTGTFKSTAYGMSVRLPLAKFIPSESSPSAEVVYLALLPCKFLDSKELVALILRPNSNAPSVQASDYIVGTTLGSHPEGPLTPSNSQSAPLPMDSYVRATILTSEQLSQFRAAFRYVDIFIAHRPSRPHHKLARDIPIYMGFASTGADFQIQLCGWSLGLLRQQRYDSSTRNSPGGYIPLKQGALDDIVMHFSIASQNGGTQGPRLEIQVGCIRTHDTRALGVVVQCGDNMKLADGHSALTGTHCSHVSSWNLQGAAAMKELGLVFPHGHENSEALALRLVFTLQPGGGAGSTPVYRLGAEISPTQSRDTQSRTDMLPGWSQPQDARRDLPVLSSPRAPLARHSGGNNHASGAHPAPRVTRDAHPAAPSGSRTLPTAGTDRWRDAASPMR